MRNPLREPHKRKHYSAHKIQDGGIMDTFGKSPKKREADRKKRKAVKLARKINRK